MSADANGVVLNAVDETSRATGSRWGGVQGYRIAEAGTHHTLLAKGGIYAALHSMHFAEVVEEPSAPEWSALRSKETGT